MHRRAIGLIVITFAGLWALPSLAGIPGLAVAARGAADADSAPRVPMPPHPRGRWIELRADSQRWISNAGEKRVVALARRLRRYRESLGRFLPELGREPARPCRIVLFRSEWEFEPYKSRRDGGATSVRGMFLPDRVEDYMAWSAGPRGVSTMQHEIVHYILRGTHSTVAPWYDEGLAELFSTVALHGKSARVGVPPDGHLERVRAHGVSPPPGGNAREVDSGFYARSWLLVHYALLEGDDGIRRLSTLKHDPSSSSTWNAELYRYALRGAPAREGVTLDPEDRAWSYSVRELSEAEILAHLGGLLVRDGSRPRQLARDHFLAALRRAPDLIDAHLGLARLCVLEGEYDEAGRYLERALELEPTRAPALLQLGELHLLQALGLDTGPHPGHVAAAATALREAVALDPALLEARVLYGKALLQQGRCEPGLELLDQVRAALPDRLDVAHDLVLMLAVCGRDRDAAALLGRVLAPAGDPRLTRSARDGLEVIRRSRAAAKLIDERRFAEAVDRLEPVLERLATAPLRHAVEEQLQAVKAIARERAASGPP